jgi:hypothetical protein
MKKNEQWKKKDHFVIFDVIKNEKENAKIIDKNDNKK